MLKLGLPVVKSRLGVPHEHLFPLPLTEPGGSPGITVVEPVVPGQLAPAPVKSAAKRAPAKRGKKDDGQTSLF